MKYFLRQLDARCAIITLLIASVVLLCPINPAASATTTCNADVESMVGHNTKADGSDADCSGAHSEIGGHVLSPVTPFDYLALLFLAVFTVNFFISYRLWYQAINNFYSTKLNYYRHRHRVSIKPKLGRTLLRWLNLLGGTVAFSF